MSLVAHLGSTAKSFPNPGFPEHVKVVVGKALYSFLVASHLGEKWAIGNSVYAFQDNSHLEDLSRDGGYLPEESRQALSELLSLRRELSDVTELETTLSQFSGIAPHLQHLVILALKDAVYSTAKYDAVIAQWLSDTTFVVGMLLESPEYLLEPFLEMLAEFQQHYVENWPIRLPHVLAFAIEKSDNPDRVKTLSSHLLLMSHNCGVGSPIQRLVHGKKWPEWHEAVATWRDNLVMVGVHSEPWVTARVRGTSAVISKLIGPRTSGNAGTDSEKPQAYA